MERVERVEVGRGRDGIEGVEREVGAGSSVEEGRGEMESRKKERSEKDEGG